jgi:nucleotide-binding universal stress UspA family protein
MERQNSFEHLNPATAASSSRTLLQREAVTLRGAPAPQNSAGVVSQHAAVRSLLVPLDGSTSAEHALPHALAIARRSGAVLRLVHVYSRLDHVDPWQMYYTDATTERSEREKHDYLWEVADRIARTDAIRLETILIESADTEDSLLKASVDADLLVMASRRRGFFRGLWSHGVADGLRPRLSIPALFVRGYPSPADLTGDPIARRILVTLDGSRVAERILDPATAIGRLEGASLTLLNVQNPDWTSGSFAHTSPAGYLTGIARTVRNAAAAVDAHVVTTDGPTAAAVTRFAARRKVDLIALATRSDGRWSRLWRGSVADSLLRSTDLPILVSGIDVERRRPDVTTVVE